MRIAKPILNGIACLMLTAASAVALFSQEPGIASNVAPDPQLAAALRDVSAERIQQTVEKLVSFKTRQTLSSASPLSGSEGIAAAAAWIQSQFEQYSKDCGNCLEVKTDEFIQQPADRVPQPTKITNIYAVLKGTDPANAERIMLVSGHYDSINSNLTNFTDPAPGANDDASGTAVSLECARVLSKHRFPATIIFLAVAGEEQGLLGSAHFAKMAKDAGWNIEAMLNNDIVGGDSTPGDTGQNPHLVRVFSEGISSTASQQELRQLRAIGGESDSPSRQLARYVQSVALLYMAPATLQPILVFRPDRFRRGGDHFSFNEQGYAAIRFCEFHENYHHQHQNVRTENGLEYGDLPKFVDYKYTANVARLNAATLASLASAPAPPANVRLIMKQYQNDSTFEWQPSPGGLAAGYEIVWRDTTAPDWQHVKAVENITSATLPVSKDNVVFALRAVDAKGHRSLTVVPVPERRQ
jgi:hypothetical protein